MLSVLIPIYREDCLALITEIRQQMISTGHPFEILIGDDSCYSPGEKQTNIPSDLNEVRLIRNSKQLGRSRNRNMLASEAKFPYLLFMDGDARVHQTDFIEKYLECLNSELVICGGTAYSELPPKEKTKTLRWVYGCQRELRTADERTNDPYRQFSSFNFLIPSELFLKIRFAEEFKAYGHEDTYFGYQLNDAEIPIKHIDNPLLHTGLDTGEEFLRKTEESIRSLDQLMRNKTLPSDFLSDIRLLRTYKRLKRTGLHVLMRALFRITRSILHRQLCSSRPRLLWFDLYKIGYLSEITA
ncbi:MAG: glycosyltransferase family 2 protein [Bacteroidetes bacterium]|nr:glycosyltransferase family 2 protein [Bacteroidota bacterium]MBT3750578.1 glycosyltransferase family 2 protein [Bacteroidota bacterium]MBT7464624.1 glycosyltransferase family 2 protein [Bacteroidota bacterium]